MGATLEVLRRQWERANLEGDFSMMSRIDDARERIEALPVRSCVWAGTDECRMCVAPESGKCPEIRIGAAA